MPAGMFHNLTFLARITILSIPSQWTKTICFLHVFMSMKSNPILISILTFAYKLHPLANVRINLSPREKHSDKKERRTMAAARCNLDNSPNVSFFVVENRKKMKTIVSRYMNSEIRLPENIARRIQR